MEMSKEEHALELEEFNASITVDRSEIDGDPGPYAGDSPAFIKGNPRFVDGRYYGKFSRNQSLACAARDPETYIEYSAYRFRDPRGVCDGKPAFAYYFD